jgi:hypothetical protein
MRRMSGIVWVLRLLSYQSRVKLVPSWNIFRVHIWRRLAILLLCMCQLWDWGENWKNWREVVPGSIVVVVVRAHQLRQGTRVQFWSFQANGWPVQDLTSYLGRLRSFTRWFCQGLVLWAEGYIPTCDRSPKHGRGAWRQHSVPFSLPTPAKQHILSRIFYHDNHNMARRTSSIRVTFTT